jgi:hypothetical protein
MHKRLPILLLGVVLLAALALTPRPTPTVTAQSGEDEQTVACQTTVREALRVVGSSCATLGTNEICYGNQQIEAILRAEDIAFNERGDIVPVTAIDNLVTQAADPNNDEWGVALMNIAADLPDSVDGSVRLVLFGGMTLEPAPQTLDDNERVTCAFAQNSPRGVNIRTGPGLGFAVVDRFAPGESVPVYAESSNGAWVRSARGWIFRELGTVTCEAAQDLPRVDNPTDTYTAPMQAFALRVTETGQCENAPQGMLVQAPDNTVANILVNGVELRVGSTASVTFNAGLDRMWLGNIEGDVAVTFDGSTHSPQPGQGVVIDVDADFNATGNLAEPALNMGLTRLSDISDTASLDVLPRAVDIATLLDGTGTMGMSAN